VKSQSHIAEEQTSKLFTRDLLFLIKEREKIFSALVDKNNNGHLFKEKENNDWVR
jgi:hypothetical protein